MKSLELSLNSTNVDHKGFSSLANGLKNRTHLHTLKLNFGKTNIRINAQLVNLCESLKNIQSLKVFSLELCETEANDEFLSQLIDPLT